MIFAAKIRNISKPAAITNTKFPIAIVNIPLHVALIPAAANICAIATEVYTPIPPAPLRKPSVVTAVQKTGQLIIPAVAARRLILKRAADKINKASALAAHKTAQQNIPLANVKPAIIRYAQNMDR